MAIRDDFTAGEVLAAADLNDTFAAKLNLAGGKVLQVVRATDATARSTTSTSYVDVTGMSVTITPQRSTSNILLIATGYFNASGLTEVIASFRLVTSANVAISGAESVLYGSGTTSAERAGVVLIGYIAAGGTSAVTFKMQFKSNVGETVQMANSSNTGQLYAIEVSA